MSFLSRTFCVGEEYRPPAVPFECGGSGKYRPLAVPFGSGGSSKCILRPEEVIVSIVVWP